MIKKTGLAAAAVLGLFVGAYSADSKGAAEYSRRAADHYTKGEYKQAIEDFSKAIEIAPKDAQGYYNRGTIYARIGESDKAIEDFTGALKSTELKSNVHTNLGVAYAQKGNHKEGER